MNDRSNPSQPATAAGGPAEDTRPSPARAICLDDILKTVGWVGTGGQAKMLIQAGDVRVNGEPETRRRRKLIGGDVVQLQGQRVVVGEDHTQR